MTRIVGLDVSQKITAICVVDDAGRRLGAEIAKRSANGKARVALARKLSVILHSVWRSGEPFRWSEYATAA